MTEVATRKPQIQIDCSPELRQRIRVVALTNGMTMRELMLKSVGEQYPELKKGVQDELTNQQ